MDKTDYTVSLEFIKFEFLKQAGCEGSFLFLLFSLRVGIFNGAFLQKLINTTVQSHLFSRGELPAEIQTGQKDTDGLLRIPGVCLPLEQRTCVQARARPHEDRSLRHH